MSSSGKVQVGSRVIVSSAKGELKGVIRWMAENPDFAVGKWVGVQLDAPMGKNNGSVKGKAYFTCPENYGLFVKPSMVRPDEERGISAGAKGPQEADSPAAFPRTTESPSSSSFDSSPPAVAAAAASASGSASSAIKAKIERLKALREQNAAAAVSSSTATPSPLSTPVGTESMPSPTPPPQETKYDDGELMKTTSFVAPSGQSGQQQPPSSGASTFAVSSSSSSSFSSSSSSAAPPAAFDPSSSEQDLELTQLRETNLHLRVAVETLRQDLHTAQQERDAMKAQSGDTDRELEILKQATLLKLREHVTQHEADRALWVDKERHLEEAVGRANRFVAL